VSFSIKDPLLEKDTGSARKVLDQPATVTEPYILDKNRKNLAQPRAALSPWAGSTSSKFRRERGNLFAVIRYRITD
jgi:hypothetical protein